MKPNLFNEICIQTSIFQKPKDKTLDANKYIRSISMANLILSPDMVPDVATIRCEQMNFGWQ